MKKIFYLLGILTVGLHAQDLTTVAKLNYLSFDNNMYIMTVDLDDDDAAYMTKAEYVIPFLVNGNLVYSASTSYNLHLGSSAATAYKLDVNGTSNFVGNSYFQSNLYLGANNFITYSGSDMVFTDLNNPGGVTLSELNTLSASIDGDNGLTKTGSYIGIGGTTSKNTTITIGDNYGFNIVSSDALFGIYLTNNSTKSISMLTNNWYVSDLKSYSFSGDSVGESYSVATNRWLLSDGRNVKRGLEYSSTFDNSAYPNAIPSVSTVETMIAAGGIGGTLDSAAVANSVDKYTIVYDNTLDYYDTIKLEIDSSTSVYEATLNITSANILAGDSLMFIESQGVNKAISINKVWVYYDYATAVYTGSNESYVKTYDVLGSASNVCNIRASFINNSTDKIRQTTDASTNLDVAFQEYEGPGFNQPVWWDGGVHAGSGTGTLLIVIQYEILDFN